MRITVFGATGGSGSRLVEQACAAGHEVTAVVRDPAGMRHEHPNLEVVRADIMSPPAIREAIDGRDAVISAIGSRQARTPTTVCTDTATSIIEAMCGTRTRRLVVVSASGLATDEGDGPFVRLVLKPLVRRILRHTFEDLLRMEEIVRASDLDWTIVRPPRLTDGPRTGNYRTALNRNVRGGLHLTRADLADGILRCLTEETAVGSTLGIGD